MGVGIQLLTLHVIRNILFLVVTQNYDAEVHKEHVILGNDVLVACEIPSFVGDLVEVVAWVDSQGDQILPSNNNFGN